MSLQILNLDSQPACDRCHGQKLRCKREAGQDACVRCTRAGAQCVSRPKGRRSSERSPSTCHLTAHENEQILENSLDKPSTRLPSEQLNYLETDRSLGSGLAYTPSDMELLIDQAGNPDPALCQQYCGSNAGLQNFLSSGSFTTSTLTNSLLAFCAGSSSDSPFSKSGFEQEFPAEMNKSSMETRSQGQASFSAASRDISNRSSFFEDEMQGFQRENSEPASPEAIFLLCMNQLSSINAELHRDMASSLSEMVSRALSTSNPEEHPPKRQKSRDTKADQHGKELTIGHVLRLSHRLTEILDTILTQFDALRIARGLDQSLLLLILSSYLRLLELLGKTLGHTNTWLEMHGRKDSGFTGTPLFTSPSCITIGSLSLPTNSSIGLISLLGMIEAIIKRANWLVSRLVEFDRSPESERLEKTSDSGRVDQEGDDVQCTPSRMALKAIKTTENSRGRSWVLSGSWLSSHIFDERKRIIPWGWTAHIIEQQFLVI